MTLPNFLIIGAAKSGTTSLYSYLEQHPQIYVKAKEPGFFAYEGQKITLNGPEDQMRFNRRVIQDRDQYEALFEGISTEKAYGEASVAYLYLNGTAERIKNYIPNVRLITILRNPVERAFSSYWHMRRDGRESLATFSEALEHEEMRIQQSWDYIWHYTQLGLYYEQLKKYYTLFSPEQIAVFLFDDLKRNPTKMVQDICQFLMIDDKFTPDTSVKYNVSGMPRLRSLHQFVSRPNQIKAALKPIVPLRMRKKVSTQVKNWNVDTNKPTMLPETKQRLQNFYREDVLRLQELIGKDLSSWLVDNES